MPERGKILNELRKKQIVDYSRIRYGNITPTDIDGFFEIHDNVFVFIELKLGDAACEAGQRLAMQRLVDAISKPSVFIVASHTCVEHSDIVPAHECVVREFRYKGDWYSPKTHILLKEAIDAFLCKSNMSEFIDESDDKDLDEDGRPRDDSWMV